MELETGTISFCDKKALNIKSNDYKRYILDTIENKHGVIFNKRNYQMYKPNHEKLVSKSGNEGMLSVLSGGNAYLLYITKDEYSGDNRVYFIDCKVCDGYEYPRIILLWLRFKNQVFKNTLLRGELVRDRSKNWIFIIDDLLVYCGRNMMKTGKYEKVSLTHKLFTMYKRDDNLELMHLRIKRYFTGDEREKVIKEYMPSLNYDSRGVMLHLKNGMNLYWNTSGDRGRRRVNRTRRVKPKEDIKHKSKKVKLSADKTDYKTERHIASSNIKMNISVTPPPSPVTKKTAILIISNTEQPDVYKLYAMKEGVKKRVSYAHVPSIDISKMLGDLFAVDDSEKLVECEYNSIFKKWSPLKVVTVGKVDSVSTVKSIKRSV